MTRRLVREGIDVGRAAAAGYAQILFGDSPLGGVLLLLALVPLAPRAAAMGALAGLAATLVARVRSYPEPEWRRGLYGYAAALAGLLWGALFAPGIASWLTLAGAAAVAAPATRLSHRLLTPRAIPTLALPSLALVWLAWPFLDVAEAEPAPGLLAQLAAWLLTFTALVLSSRLLALGALLGVAAALGVSVIAGGAWMAGIVANAVPTAIALGTVLVPATPGALAVATLGAAAAGALWWTVAAWAPPLPPLVAPFTLVTILVVTALRAEPLRRRWRRLPAPLPLIAAGAPEAALRSARAGRRLRDLASGARTVAVLTGAGVSTAAGLPDFRGPAGLWGRTRLITFEDFVSSPEQRARYWAEEERFFRLVERSQPTATHRALAELHRRRRLSGVVTQNVDGLHQAAGLPPEAVVELHGSIRHAVCLDCSATVPRASLSPVITGGGAALYCSRCQGLLKGGSIMFGEPVSGERLDAATRAVLEADLLLVLGTSLLVQPASDLLRWAREAGIPIAIVNAMPTPYDDQARVSVIADVDAVMLDLLEVLGSARAEAGVHPGLDGSGRRGSKSPV